MILGNLGQLWAVGLFIVFILLIIVSIKVLMEKEEVANQPTQTPAKPSFDKSPIEKSSEEITEPKRETPPLPGKVIEPPGKLVEPGDRPSGEGL